MGNQCSVNPFSVVSLHLLFLLSGFSLFLNCFILSIIIVSFPMFYPNFTPALSFSLLYLFLSCCIFSRYSLNHYPPPLVSFSFQLYFYIILLYYCIIFLPVYFPFLPVSFPFLLYQLSLVGCIIPFLYFSLIMEPSYPHDLLSYPSFCIRLLFLVYFL